MRLARNQRYYGHVKTLASNSLCAIRVAYNLLHMPLSGLKWSLRVRVLFFAALFSATLCLAPLCSAKDLAVVTNKANSTTDIAQADLVKIFKGTTTKWPDGKEITLVLIDPNSPDMKIAVQKLYGSTPTEVVTQVAAMNQAHHGSVLVVNSSDALLQAVGTNPGAIGVVDVYSITSAIKVLKVAGKSPLEPGYLLHGN